MKQVGVIEFARSLYSKHPELEHPVRWTHFIAMALRSGVSIRVVPLSRPARLIRYGQSLCIRVNYELNTHLRTRYGMHELCHVWRDELGMACIYADDETVAKDPNEDFADLFAWYVTSEARIYQIPLADRPVSAGFWQGKLKQLQALGYSEHALAIASSETEGRIRQWIHGKGKPGVDTARIFDRILSAEKRRESLLKSAASRARPLERAADER